MDMVAFVSMERVVRHMSLHGSFTSARQHRAGWMGYIRAITDRVYGLTMFSLEQTLITLPTWLQRIAMREENVTELLV